MYYKQQGTIHKWCIINIEVGVLVECCECCLCVGQLHWGFSQFEVSWPSVSHQRFHGKNVSYVWQSLSSGSVCLSLSLGQSLDGVLIAQPHIKPECFLLGFVVQLGNTDMHNVCVCVCVCVFIFSVLGAYSMELLRSKYQVMQVMHQLWNLPPSICYWGPTGIYIYMPSQTKI